MERSKKVYHQEFPEGTKLSEKNSGCYGCKLLEECVRTRKDKEAGICETLYQQYHSLEKI
jgi:hypothetical protein